MNLRPLNSLYSDGPSQLGTGYSDYRRVECQNPGDTAAPSARLPNGLILSGPEVDPIPAGGVVWCCSISQASHSSTPTIYSP